MYKIFKLSKFTNLICFPGICLPKNLNDFFTPQKPPERSSIKDTTDSVTSKDTDDLTSYDYDDMIHNLDAKQECKVNAFQHNPTECLLCCLKGASTNAEESQRCIELTKNNKDWNIIIKHIQKVANPVWCKQSKQKLLDLKQRHPQSFQDICLFSEVSKILGTFSFRPIARRFIQEIFYDLDFKLLHETFLALIGEDIFRELKQVESNNVPEKRASLQIETEKKATSLNRSSSNQDENSLYDSFSFNKEHSRSSDTCSTPLYPELSRPRFHTFVLDLSCTKNKFPIRDREVKDVIDQH